MLSVSSLPLRRLLDEVMSASPRGQWIGVSMAIPGGGAYSPMVETRPKSKQASSGNHLHSKPDITAPARDGSLRITDF
jgi:hypothetical protein